VKVIKEGSSEKALFGALKEGDPFAYGNEFYMKIEESTSKTGSTVNAIEISYGQTWSFKPADLVGEVDAKVVIS